MKKMLSLSFLICATIIFCMSVKVNGTYWNSLSSKEKTTSLTEQIDFSELKISVDSGDINIKSSEKEFLQIIVKYKEEKNELSFELNSGKLVPKAPIDYGYIITEISIYTPKELSVLADTGSGEVQIYGLNNKSINVRTSSGDIYVKNSQTSRMVLKSGSGIVNIFNCENSSKIIVETGSGDIDINTVSNIKHLDVDTGSGEIRLINSSAKQFYAKSGSGDIMLEKSLVNVLYSKTGSGEVLSYESTINKNSSLGIKGDYIKVKKSSEAI